jgi:hypothetical protein
MFSFSRQKRDNRLRTFLARAIDLTNPHLPPIDGETRVFDRYNRTIPVLLTPWEKGGPVIGESATAVTKDISDQGLSVILRQPYRCVDVVVGFWLPESRHIAAGSGPTFVLGEVRQHAQIGGGYWQLGISFTELLKPSYTSELELLVPVAAKLLPPGDRGPTLSAGVRG